MGAIPEVLLQHSCAVDPWLGTSGNGVEVFGPAITIDRCFVDTGTKGLTRGNVNGGTGDERTTPVTVYAQLDLDTSAMVVRSRIRWDLGSGPQQARVDTVQRLDGAGLPVPSHVMIKGV